jgi:hypothetical protein
MATLVATDLNLSTRSQLLNHARFFKSWLRRIAPDTHLDQACCLIAFANSPSGIAAPEELQCRHASKGLSQLYGYRYLSTNPIVAHMAGDSTLLQTGDDESAIHSLLVVSSQSQH